MKRRHKTVHDRRPSRHRLRSGMTGPEIRRGVEETLADMRRIARRLNLDAAELADAVELLISRSRRA